MTRGLNALKVAPALMVCFHSSMQAQPPPQVFQRVEAGLEQAIQWQWQVEPSSFAEQMKALKASRLPSSPAPNIIGNSSFAKRPQQTYVVQKGDALVKIARRFNVSVESLKAANQLDSSLIRIGQTLIIPEEIDLPAPQIAESSSVKQGLLSNQRTGPANIGSIPLPEVADYDPTILTTQIYLDRQNLSSGPITGKNHIAFQGLMMALQKAKGQSPAIIQALAEKTITRPFTRYQLKKTDLDWIQPLSLPKKKSVGPDHSGGLYQALTSQTQALYRSAWEFVAERYHCDEAFLRRLNPAVKAQPTPGTFLIVPAVEPFEIENYLESPARPLAPPVGFDSENLITAFITDLSRLDIYRGLELIASFPVSRARPGLRGRSEWLILDSIEWPRLVTRRLPRNPNIEASPLPIPEVLPPGPRNPVGIHWIHLARVDDPEPLPFGLHGTSIPNRMSSTESLGGFRMTNWDILRASRILPVGTSLRWRRSSPQTVRPPETAPATIPTPLTQNGQSSPGAQN